MAQQSDWSEMHWQGAMRVLGLPNEDRYRYLVEKIHGFVEADEHEKAAREANNLAYLIKSEEGYLRDQNAAFDTALSRQNMAALILERVELVVQILDEDGDPINRADLDDIDGDPIYDPANGGLDWSGLSDDNNDAVSDIPPDPNRVSDAPQAEQYEMDTMNRMERQRAEMNGEGDERSWPSVSEFRNYDEDSVDMNEWLDRDVEGATASAGGALPDGVEALSLAEFLQRLPESVDAMIQENMERIVEAMRVPGDGRMAGARIDTLAKLLEQNSAPEDAARVNGTELRSYIRQIALNKKAQEDEAGSSHLSGSDDGGGSDGGNGRGGPSDHDNDGDDGHFSRYGRTSLDDIIEGNQLSQAGVETQRQNGEAPSAPSGTTTTGNSPLLQLIRSATHLNGTQVVNAGMQNVRNALIERDMAAAHVAARQLASELLSRRGDPQSQGLAAAVQKVADMIVKEIDGALSEDEKKPAKSAHGNDGPDPRNGPRRDPDGGNPGAGAANGGAGNGGAAPNGEKRPASVYDLGTMERMERERKQSAGTKEELTAVLSGGIQKITELLVEKKNEEATQHAVALSKRLEGNGGLVPELPPQTILKIAHGKATALMAGKPEPSPTMPVAGEDGVDDDDPGITLDPETAARLVPVTDWKVFCGVYKIEEKEIKNIKALALKAVREPKDAISGCKSIISRRKGKDQGQIKNEKYLAQALVHAVKMKAAKKQLTKPMKASRSAGM